MSVPVTASGAPSERRWSLFGTRSGRGVVIGVLVGMVVCSVVAQRVRDERFHTDAPGEQVLYVQSPEVVKRLVLSYDDLAADVYWIRALQHFGKTRLQVQDVRQAMSPYELLFPRLTAAAPFGVRDGRASGYPLLYPLLDMATTLDPLFNIAYRFGAIFLSEAPPAGPGRPDLAIALLEKGMAAAPERWQYYQDAGFVNYWSRRDYAAAADWFERAGRIDGAPWWLKPLAANTLAVGGSRAASRTLYQALAQSAENDFMREDAARRLHQLDALDLQDALRALVARYRARGGGPPYTWRALIRAGLLQDVPTDPMGYPFLLMPDTGDVQVHPESTLRPLPAEPPAAMRPPA